MVVWSETITKVDNGYILSHYDPELNELKKVVFEYVDEEDDTKMEQLTIQKVFYYLMDYFAVNNNKHANDGKGQYITIKVDGEDD